MSAILDRIKHEPALVTTLVGACISLGAVFGLSLSADQTAAVMGFTAAVVAVLIRAQVTPVSTTA